MQAGKHDQRSDILIGFPWSWAVRIPANLTGLHARFALYSSGTLIQAWTDATSAVVIDAYDAGAGTTRVRFALPHADTLLLTAQTATYVVETATNLTTEDGGVRWLEGKAVITK